MPTQILLHLQNTQLSFRKKKRLQAHRASKTRQRRKETVNVSVLYETGCAGAFLAKCRYMHCAKHLHRTVRLNYIGHLPTTFPTWVNISSILYELSHRLHVPAGYGLRIRKLPGEPERDADLRRADVRVRRDNRAAGVVDALPHHVFPENAFLLLEHLRVPQKAEASGLGESSVTFVHLTVQYSCFEVKRPMWLIVKGIYFTTFVVDYSFSPLVHPSFLQALQYTPIGAIDT